MDFTNLINFVTPSGLGDSVPASAATKTWKMSEIVFKHLETHVFERENSLTI